jgi:site-specific DNA-cytosine methylase
MTFVPVDDEYVPDAIESITSKWAKGSGGPSGDETMNLVLQRDIDVFVKSKRAATVEEDETWITDAPAPTLNSIDNTSDVYATVLAVESSDVIAIEESPLAFDSRMSSLTGVFDDVTSSLKAQDQPAVFAGESSAARVRRLSPVECCRLMGWPDDHTTVNDGGRPLSDSARYRMAGNGIAAPAMRWVASQVAAVLNSEGNTQ